MITNCNDYRQADGHRRQTDAERQDAIIRLCKQGKRNRDEWLRRAKLARRAFYSELAMNLEAQALRETVHG